MNTQCRLASIVMMVGLSLILAGCGGTDTVSEIVDGTGDTFSGTIAGADGESGTLEVTVASTESASVTATGTLLKAATVTATGTLTIGGETTSLTGTYNSSTGDFTLSGGGYTFTGNLADGKISGTYSGPSQNGAFSLLVEIDGAGVTNFCGFWEESDTGDDDDIDSGVWNISISSDGEAGGSWAGTTGAGLLTGSVSGNTITIEADADTTATGTIFGDEVSGTWVHTDTEEGGGEVSTGTFEGGPCSS